MDDGAERFLAVFNVRLGTRDYRFDRIAKHLFGYIGLAKLKSVTQNSAVVCVPAQLFDVALGFLAESFEQQAAEMFRR